MAHSTDSVRKRRATPERLRAYANAFERLRDGLGRAASHATRQQPLAVHLQRAAIQAGTLIQQAVGEGCFPDDWTDHEGKPARRYFGVATLEKLGWKFSSPDEKSSMIWSNTMCSWLRRSYPGRVKSDLGRYDWREYARNSNGEFVDSDGKPITHIRTEHPDGTIEYKPSGKPVPTTAGYDQRAWLDHQFARASDYTEACALLAELFRERAKMSDADEWLSADQLRCYVTQGALTKLAGKHPNIRRRATPDECKRFGKPKLVYVYNKRLVYELTEGARDGEA